MHVALDPDDVRELTRAWQGDRLSDGRPRVPDAVLARLRTVTTEQAWGVLRDAGYHLQFSGEWMETHPGTVIVGRALTSSFLPHRPDLDAAVVAAGARDGHHEADKQNSWVISMLQRGDVMVTDIFGKVAEGTVIGDNLGTAVAVRTGVGAVIDGGVRDLAGLQELEGVNVFCRGTHPTAIADVVLAGVNLPVRIGEATVLPGDVVLGTPSGVIFIPAHLAERVADAAEEVSVRDEYGKGRIADGSFTSAEIDVEPWAEHIEAAFATWRSGRAGVAGVAR
ncbi:MAG: RraA family protein [Terracoccus sp.]